MYDEIKYIGAFDEDEISKNSSIKVKKDIATIPRIKINNYNPQISKFISSTKVNLLNRKVIGIMILILVIYLVKPISFLRAKLDEKREYYAQLSTETNNYSLNGIIESITYTLGTEYYKNCKNTMVYPADGLITIPYDLAHQGIDIACDEYPGNIYAAANGNVSYIGYSEKYGNEIIIQHEINGITLYTYYSNLSSINVTVGQYVYQNQVIALEGGNPDKRQGIMETDGHHLHFEVRKTKDSGSGLNPSLFIQ
jgi:hypothetical protein